MACEKINKFVNALSIWEEAERHASGAANGRSEARAEQLSWLSRGSRRFFTGLPMRQHGSEHRQHLLHTRRQSDVFACPRRAQPLGKGGEPWGEARGPMESTVRPCARPPQMVRRPRTVPLSPWRGATPPR